MPNTTGLEETVFSEIENRDGETEQEELVEILEDEGLDEIEVLRTLRSLMEQDEISYSVDWEIRLKD